MQQRPSFLAFGFSAASAVATYRLQESQEFDVYTYWPCKSVRIESEVYGSVPSFEPKQFNAKQPKDLPFKTFNVVLLVVPTVNDIKVMCDQLKPVISKTTLILVDVSSGMGPLQRHVKSILRSSSLVMGAIIDIEADLSRKNGTQFQVTHRKMDTSGSIITIEPVASSKQLAPLESAFNKGNVSASHPKNTSAFGEIQWQRTIGVVAFELLGFTLKIPEPENVLKNIAAQPIVAGLVSELSMVATACGVKGMPNTRQLIARGPKLARKAPQGFHTPNASRIFYDHSLGINPPLDSLLLLPILLSSELSKGGPTPYLECLYTFASRLLETDASASVNPKLMEDLSLREDELKHREAKYNEMHTQLVQKNKELEREIKNFKEKVSETESKDQAEAEDWKSELRRLEDELVKKERMLAQKEGDLYNREHAVHSREHYLRQAQAQQTQAQQAQGQPQVQGQPQGQLQPQGQPTQRNGNAISIVSSNGSSISQDITRDESANLSNPQLPAPMGAPSANNSMESDVSRTPPQSGEDPTHGIQTPGGTTYSRFDPKAPVANQSEEVDTSAESFPEQTPGQYNGYYGYGGGYGHPMGPQGMAPQGMGPMGPMAPMGPVGPNTGPGPQGYQGYAGYGPPPSHGRGMPPSSAGSMPGTPAQGFVGGPNGPSVPGYPQAYPLRSGTATPVMGHAPQFYGTKPASMNAMNTYAGPRPRMSAPPPPMSGGGMPPYRPSSRNQMTPNHFSMQFAPNGAYPGNAYPNNGYPSNGYPKPTMRKPNPRKTLGDDVDMMSMTAGRSRNRGVSQIAPSPATAAPAPAHTFSQDFQLDGVMGSATDRYHFVSRSKKPDPKLSSDDSALQAQRKAHISGKSDISFDLENQPRQFTPSQLASPPRNRKPVASNGMTEPEYVDFNNTQ